MPLAVRQGYAEMVVLLLSHGANPEATTLRHLSPLHLAAHEGHLNVSRLLLEAWAPVDDRDRAGNTPLHLAAQKGHIDVIRLLLQCGADKDGVEENGWAALHFAVWQGHTGVARMLLQAGVNAKVIRDTYLAVAVWIVRVSCLSFYSNVAYELDSNHPFGDAILLSQMHLVCFYSKAIRCSNPARGLAMLYRCFPDGGLIQSHHIMTSRWHQSLTTVHVLDCNVRSASLVPPAHSLRCVIGTTSRPRFTLPARSVTQR